MLLSLCCYGGICHMPALYRSNLLSGLVFIYFRNFDISPLYFLFFYNLFKSYWNGITYDSKWYWRTSLKWHALYFLWRKCESHHSFENIGLQNYIDDRYLISLTFIYIAPLSDWFSHEKDILAAKQTDAGKTIYTMSFEKLKMVRF